MSFVTRSPWTGKILTNFQYSKFETTQQKSRTLAQSLSPWNAVSLEDRCHGLRNLGEALERSHEEFASMINKEMGKPMSQARSEILKSVDLINWYASKTPEILARSSSVIENPRGFDCRIQHEPLGVILGLMPWNFPVWQVFRWAVPTLLVGNTCLLKPAEQTAGTGELIAKLFNEHFEPIIFDTVHMQPSVVHEVISHDVNIRGVSFTGSTRVGKLIAATAGGALKKCVTELGGSDAFLVMEDAGNIEEIANLAVKMRIMNSGQSCISPKRIIVHAKHFDRFKFAAIEALRALRYADDYGPLVDLRAKENLQDQRNRGLQQGATLIAELPEMPLVGCHLPPCIIQADPSNVLAQEEVFGPIVVLLRARDDQHAVEIANNSPFGLGCSVFNGRDKSVVSDINAGMCFLNATVRSDARLPFGGTKESGIGRECAEFGLKEFANIKLVCVAS